MRILFFLLISFSSIAQSSVIFLKQGKLSDSKEIVICIGDSNSAGTNGSTGNGPYVSAGQAFYYNRSPIGIRNLLPDIIASPSGSQYPQAAITYYSSSGKRIIFVPTGSGGSYISNTGTNWSTSGTLYALMQTDVTRAIDITGKQLKGIYICLSINDIVGGVSVATMQAAWDSLLSRLQSDYPGVPICIDKMGASNPALTNLVTMQAYVAGKASATITVIEGMSSMQANGWFSDTIHPIQTGNNYRGTLIGGWLLSLTY